MMPKTIVVPGNRMAAQGRVLEESASCLLDAVRIEFQRSCGAARVSDRACLKVRPFVRWTPPDSGVKNLRNRPEELRSVHLG